jgi:hypothetical protein
VIFASRLQKATLLVAALCVHVPAVAVTVAPGDVVATRILVTSIPNDYGQLMVLDSALRERASFGDYDHYVALGGPTIAVSTLGGLTFFDASFNEIKNLSPGYEASIAADAAGNVYGLVSRVLNVWDRNGQLLRQIPLPDSSPQFLDIAPDGCTLWYSGSAGPLRHDVCSNAPLPSFGVSKNFFFARGLTGGGLVGGYRGDLLVYDHHGILIRTMHLGDDSALMLDAGFSPDGQYMYVSIPGGGTGMLRKVRISDGVTVASIPTGNFLLVTSIRVVGEQRPTAEALGPAAVPMLSPWLLASLALALSLIALRRAG